MGTIKKEKIMRHLPNVIDKMIKIIPDSKSVIGALKSIKKSSMYGAPEMQVDFWNQTAHALNNYLGVTMDTDWKQKVGDIFADKEKGDVD